IISVWKTSVQRTAQGGAEKFSASFGLTHRKATSAATRNVSAGSPDVRGDENEELRMAREKPRLPGMAPAEARDFAASIMDALAEPVLLLDKELRVQTANRAYYRAFAESTLRIRDNQLYAISNGWWDIPGVRDMIDRIASGEPSQELEIQRDFPRLGHRAVLL